MREKIISLFSPVLPPFCLRIEDTPDPRNPGLSEQAVRSEEGRSWTSRERYDGQFRTLSTPPPSPADSGVVCVALPREPRHRVQGVLLDLRKGSMARWKQGDRAFGLLLHYSRGGAVLLLPMIID